MENQAKRQDLINSRERKIFGLISNQNSLVILEPKLPLGPEERIGRNEPENIFQMNQPGRHRKVEQVEPYFSIGSLPTKRR